MFQIYESLKFVLEFFSVKKGNLVNVILGITLIIAIMYSYMEYKAVSEKIIIQQNKIHNSIVKEKELNNTIMNNKFESEQKLNKEKTISDIKNIDTKNKITTPNKTIIEKNKSKTIITIDTKQDVNKLDKLEPNKGYVLEIR